VDLLAAVLLLLGCGFLVANLWLSAEFVAYLRRRRQAVLTWPGPRPRFYGLMLAIGVALGVLVFVELVFQRRPVQQAFGELMMFTYYGYLMPLSRLIGRGFYEDGVWSESGFMRYGQIGGIAWREGEELTLILISRMRNLARRLVVPPMHYGAARRLLRDKITAHDIHFSGTSLDLGGHDEREDV
jgi:hypothetical protein